MIWAVFLLLVSAAGCGGGEDVQPNVLLVTVDTLRPDRLSAYGYRGHETPHVDRLAAEGALFENAWTDTPWTTPSMASVMTGVYPTRHGFRSTNTNRLDPENLTLAEILGASGYATAAVIGSFPLDAVFQLDQGFDHYDDSFTTPIWIHPDVESGHLESEFRDVPEEQAMFTMAKAMNDSRRTDEEVTEAAAKWLREAPSRPFFLWVHYFGPHSKPDWRVPEHERLRRQLARYAPDVQIVDRELGRLLDVLEDTGGAADSLVIFHADHGESLGENDYVGHGQLLNDASMRIPLILRWPGRIAAGRRIDELARNVDILPTVLEAARIPVPEALSGRSLLPLASKAPLHWLARLRDGDPVAYMETYYPAHGAFAAQVRTSDGTEYKVGAIRRGVRRGRWQLVRTEPRPLMDVSDPSWDEIPEAARARLRREELFDLQAEDPGAEDLAAAQPKTLESLRRLLDARIAEEGSGSPRLELDDEKRLRLESLGYGK
jgi:arylsulfatase A-like enzyme